jgi:drug/metabolite transporter (DMT)-like permease
MPRKRWSFWVSAGYLTVVLIWSTTWYGIQTQVNGTSPHVAVALRMGAASLIFMSFGLLTRRSLRFSLRQAKLIGIQGVCFCGLNYLAVYAGSQYLTSGVVAVLVSLALPLNLVAEWLLSGARPSASSMIAAAIGVGGVGLIFSSELSGAFADQSAWWGAGS